MSKNTGIVKDRRYLRHGADFAHPETPKRLVSIYEMLDNPDMAWKFTGIEARHATREELARVHRPSYIDFIAGTEGKAMTMLDPDTVATAETYDTARLAAGGVMNAIDSVVSGETDNAFALVRPPGHHALRNRGMGFCLFNNVAVAARYALSERGASRVAIVDFDVHHGNGTQEAFEADPAVLYISMHQYPYYPGTGHWDETGQAAGIRHLVNVPLTGAVGDTGYLRIMDEIVAPAVRRFAPQLILVSAGYDAHWDDPLASMRLSVTGYARIARVLRGLAAELCGGRLVFTLEGGYHLDALAYSVLNTFGVLLGAPDSACIDPLGPSPYRERDVDDVVSHVKRVHGL